MSAQVDTMLLKNCTIIALDRFSHLTQINDSIVETYNRSEVLELIADMIDKENQLHSFTDLDSVKTFMKECIFPSPTRAYELPWEIKSIWSVIFGAMLFVAITGNAIVLWIVLAHRRMRTVTNYFLLNLSVADLLMSLLNCVFNFIFMLNADWPFGSLYCTINNFIANVSVASSVFTLVAISFDRYIAIVHPLQHRTSRKKAIIFLLIIWAMSCILASPNLMYSSIRTKKYYNGKTTTICFMLWPDGNYPDSVADYVYNIIFFTLTYAIPILIMIVCYTLMGRELWGSRSIGEHTERQFESMKSKKKVVRMFIIIVTIFALCWLPYQLFFIFAYHNKQISTAPYVQHLYLGFYWFAMSNAMVNPIIYYWMNGRFRIYFQEIICCCCFRLWKSRHKNDLFPGILLHKHSQSDFGRSRSCRQKSMSTHWERRQNTAEMRVRNVSINRTPNLRSVRDQETRNNNNNNSSTTTQPTLGTTLQNSTTNFLAVPIITETSHSINNGNLEIS